MKIHICKTMVKFSTFLIIIVLLSCNKEPDPEKICYTEDYPPRNNEKVTINQGLWGDVWFWEGDFMPVGFGTICQVQRTVYIYEITDMTDLVRVQPYTPFYSQINSNLITTVESGPNGFFQVELDPGLYSIFIMEGTNYYSNRFDGQGAVFPVLVESGKVAEIRFDITYDATF